MAAVTARTSTIRRAAALLVWALLAAACGSTVQIGADGQPVAGVPGAVPGADASGLGAGSGDGLDVASGGGDTQSATGGGATGTSAGVPGSSGGAAGPVTPAGTGSSGSTQGGGGGGGGVPGLSADKIAIGFGYSENASAANDAAGLEGASRGNQKGYMQLMLKWINEQGGIFGREVVPVYHVYDGADARPHPQKEQEACDTFTQDNEVFAVATTAEQTLITCLHNAGVPLFSVQGMRAPQEDLLAKWPLYFEVANLELNAVAKAQVAGLHRQGYFKPRSATETDIKVGLVRYDETGFRRATQEAMIPALRRYGLKLDEQAEITAPQGLNDYGSVGSQVQGAILRFQREGINRVMFMESSGDLALFWMNAAEGQQYRPRYGLTSNDAGEILAANVPHSQLVDSIGVGWSPGADTKGSQALPAWPARKLCRKVYKEGGYEFADLNAEGVAMLYCDGVRFLQASAKASPSGATPQGLVAGAERLGTSFQSASGNGATRFSRSRHFGVTEYRMVAWFTSCDCFKYLNGARPYNTPS